MERRHKKYLKLLSNEEDIDQVIKEAVSEEMREAD